MTLAEQFGNIDIYVFDQLLRGRIAPGMRVFDAGCGGGRNLVYLLRSGYEVCGNDADAGAIARCGRWPRHSAPGRRARFSRRADRADVVSRSACRRRDRQRRPALRPRRGAFRGDAAAAVARAEPRRRVLRPPGQHDRHRPKRRSGRSGQGRYRLPDGSDRFLVDAATIESWTARLGGVLIDPIKTTVVHEQRAMTTWVARRAVSESEADDSCRDPAEEQPRLGRRSRQGRPEVSSRGSRRSRRRSSCGSAVPTAACRPMRSSASIPASCSSTATSPTWSSTPT